MSILKQNCKMANASIKYSDVVCTENDILGAALEGRKTENLKRRSLLVVNFEGFFIFF